MTRVFLALPIADDVALSLSLMQGGIAGARWTARADFHLTLTFLGECDNETLADIDAAMNAVSASAFDYQLAGANSFSQGDWPTVLWMGIEAPPALADLKTQIDARLREYGITFEKRKYSPHVTMARLRRTDEIEVARFIQAHNLYRSRVLHADKFILYESAPRHTGTETHYVPLAEYPLLPV